MATGNDRQPPRVKRTYVLDGAIDQETGEFVQPRARAQQIVDDLMAAGWSVGGVLRVVFDRVKVGELPPVTKGGPREPLGETVGVVIEYQANTPLNLESLTERLLEGAYEDAEVPDAAGGLGGELEAMAAAGEQGEGDDADGAGDDDETEQGD